MFCGIFHCTVAAVLSVFTIASYCLASLKSAGAPANIRWGSYPMVEKNDLENYTFCTYCSKPKPPRAHHCRSCKMCVVDMDHHCPFVSWINLIVMSWYIPILLPHCLLLISFLCCISFFVMSSADWKLCGSFKSPSFCHFSYICGHELQLCCYYDHLCKLSYMAPSRFSKSIIIWSLKGFYEITDGDYYYLGKFRILLVSEGYNSVISCICQSVS
jgi:ribosomal protein L40E